MYNHSKTIYNYIQTIDALTIDVKRKEAVTRIRQYTSSILMSRIKLAQKETHGNYVLQVAFTGRETLPCSQILGASCRHVHFRRAVLLDFFDDTRHEEQSIGHTVVAPIVLEDVETDTLVKVQYHNEAQKEALAPVQGSVKAIIAMDACGRSTVGRHVLTDQRKAIMCLFHILFQ